MTYDKSVDLSWMKEELMNLDFVGRSINFWKLHTKLCWVWIFFWVKNPQLSVHSFLKIHSFSFKWLKKKKRNDFSNSTALNHGYTLKWELLNNIHTQFFAKYDPEEKFLLSV